MTAAKRKAGRPKGSRNKPKNLLPPDLVSIINRRVSVEEREKLLDTYFLITGRRVRLPKEVMLSAMQYFEENAIEYAAVLQANLRAQQSATSIEAKAVLAAAVADAEAKVDRYVALAGDMAFKAAPFMHARLAAVINSSGTDRTNESLFQMLMRDLDEAGKPPRYIEHRADEFAEQKR